MEVFFDNDVVLKLAEYELLDAFLDLLDHCACQTFILPTLSFVAGINNPKRAAKIFSSEDKLTAIQRLVDKSKIAEMRKAETVRLANSINVPNLDPGELALIACVTESDAETGLVTGDKRAVQALNNITDLTGLLTQCWIIMLEHIVRYMLVKLDPVLIIEKIQHKPHLDVSLRICFKGKTLEAIEQIIEALNSYTYDIEKNCEKLTFFPVSSSPSCSV